MRAKRTDGNQKSICESLKKCGVQVIDCSNLGNSFPDLLLGFGGTWSLLELKVLDGGTLSRGQIKFLSQANGYVGLADTFEGALRLAKLPATFALTQAEKQTIAAFLVRWKGEEISYRKFLRECNLERI